ncbi:MAG TPA: two-component regulator propeller domain-containing protein, partial [Flavisolibacter sp.]|nr:two-component regulator propeller domain-containing protein [Flavisolibacter sp.]
LLWFATEDGLDKFDGIGFQVYRQKSGDPTSLQANEILALHEDKAGNLWVGTSGGSLSLYDRKKDAFINFPASAGPGTIGNSVIRSICSDENGKIWIAHYDGVNILDPVTRRVSVFPLPAGGSGLLSNRSGLCVFNDSRHRIWIGTTDGLFLYQPKTKSVVLFAPSADPSSLAGNIVNSLAEDKQGNIWVGTNNGLSRLRPGEKCFVTYRQEDKANSISSNFINSIAVDGNKLWLATSQGLNIFDTQTGAVEKYAFNYRNMHSLSAPAVRCIYIDRQGIYWLGMIAGGVDKYDKNLNLFNYVQSNLFDEKGLNAPVVTSFAENKDGHVYVGTDGGGLSLFNPDTRLFQHFNIQSRRNGADRRLLVQALKMRRNNQLLIGTYADGLFIFDPASGGYQQLMKGTAADDLNSSEIFCLEEDSKGNVWIGTNGDGIDVLNTENKVVKKYTPNPKMPKDVLLPFNGYIRAIEEDRDGNIWIATYGGGVAVLQPASGQFTVYNTTNSELQNDKVLSLLEDSRGNIWAGTFGGGLSVFNKKTKQFTTFSEGNGLPNNAVYTILEDRNGLIWVSTNKGISSLDPVTKKFRNYNYHNGVQNNNFVHGAGLRLSDGELFFGGLDGFNYVNPAFLKKNTNIPIVLLTDLRVANQSVVPSADGPIRENIAIAKEIDLDYKQNVALSYVGLNYTSPEQNQYAYKLEGFDRDWNYVGNATTASYTNLDPGQYTFRVKASNNDGVWNQQGATIKITVHPPFWRTTAAY